MAKRSIRFRARGSADVEGAIDHFRREAGEAIALDFVDDLEQTIRRIRSSPQLGSLRFSYELDIPELRAIGLNRFPYLIFYVPHDGTIEIWRVLHTRRDIPTTLADQR